MKRKISLVGLLVMVAVCSALVGMFISTSLSLSPHSEALPFWRDGASTSTVHVVMPSLSTLAKSTSPTVVNVRTANKIPARELYRHFEGPGGENDWFNEFFQKFFDKLPEKDLKQKSLGSGFIISRDGYVLTNNHVIREADEIFVSLSDNEEYKAALVGKDDNTDIALIKIESDRKDFPVSVLGDSDMLEIGDWVFAIGNPFGFGHTLTQGIVSAKARVIGAGPYDSFIQTDAAINPGNSGGPLMNMDGQVVGINTAIVSSGNGIGFAIPINMVKDILPELKDKGEVTRGWLGVAIQEVTPEIARAVGLDNPAGAMVTMIYSGDPADRAGVKPGDIILRINSQDIDDPHGLTRYIGSLKPDSKVEIVVWRESRKLSLETRLKKRIEENIASLGQIPDESEEIKDRFGIVLKDLTPDVKRQFNLEDAGGILVIDIDPNGSAAKSRLEKMDIIKEAGGSRVDNIEEYLKAMKGVRKGQAVLMLVHRDSRPMYIAVDAQ
ncbi:MAG TPA: Do family serine endopeptidase [Deltaproteobacteria bacterium]|nr:Do family serine endopeptidase [Deltaproteobacteria bacterium]